LKNTAVEFLSIYDFCGFFGSRVLLVFNSHALNNFFCRELPEFGHLDKGNQFDIPEIFGYPVLAQVSIVKVSKSQVVKRCMSRYTHYYSASVFRFYKGCRKGNYFIPSNRVCEFYSYYGFCRHILNILDCPVSKCKFLESFPADNPELFASILRDFCFYISHIRVDPEVSHSICRFRPEGCTGQYQI